MSIKSAEAERLTRELAEVTGESLTTAVTEAVRERLQRLRGGAESPQELAERLLALGQSIAAVLPEPWASRPHGELLYDDVGLPR